MLGKDINTTVLTGVDGKQLTVVGTAEIELSIAAYACCVDFVVIDNISHNVILGLEALNNLQAVVDLSNSTLSITNKGVISRSQTCQTCLCSRTFVISGELFKLNVKQFTIAFDEQLNRL